MREHSGFTLSGDSTNHPIARGKMSGKIVRDLNINIETCLSIRIKIAFSHRVDEATSDRYNNRDLLETQEQKNCLSLTLRKRRFEGGQQVIV
jgi:hypothetical protein